MPLELPVVPHGAIPGSRNDQPCETKAESDKKKRRTRKSSLDVACNSNRERVGASDRLEQSAVELPKSGIETARSHRASLTV